MKTWILLPVLIVLAALAWWFYDEKKPPTTITSFEECAAAGYPIMESYPPQCRTKDGKSFTQDIGNELELTDRIQITSPRPTATVTSPLVITGEARGTWYFEATFPIKLLDSNGVVLAEHYAQAQSEWMTENFVPFTATLTFVKPLTKNGTLILMRDNPSGLPENDAELRVPIQFGP